MQPLSFQYDHKRDSERLCILISMTVWAIWKSRNKNPVNNQGVTTEKARETLRELISDLVRKSWNAERFMEGARGCFSSADSVPSGRIRYLATLTLQQVQPSTFHNEMWPCSPVWEGRQGGFVQQASRPTGKPGRSPTHAASMALRCTTHFPPFSHQIKIKIKIKLK